MKNFVPLSDLLGLPLSKKLNAVTQLYITRCLDDTEVL